MKTKWFYLLSLSFLLAFSACSNDGDDQGSPKDSNANKNVVSASVPTEATGLEFPKIVANGTSRNVVLVRRTADYGVTYSTYYDMDKKSPRWCCYQICQSNNKKNWTRKKWEGATWMGKKWSGDPFQKDPDVDADCQPPVTREFSTSGYDRGHIVASEDRVYSQDANGQTFYMTNMYPQMHSFNAGIWADMEKLVRNFLTYDMSTQASHAKDTLYVCKGGTIDSSDQILNHTENGYIVPKYFFCAVLLKNAKGYQAIGFWFRHSAYGSSETVKGHVVNIKRLEELTGLDFFCNLPDDIERSVENASCDPNTVKEKWGF